MKVILTFMLGVAALGIRAQTGIYVPSMSHCDESVTSLLSTYGIPGATVAIARNGKLVYMRGFGMANTARTVPTQPYHLFRIASVSKPVTSVAVMKLIEEGRINLSDKVFGTGGILGSHEVFSRVSITDARIYGITVQHLLEHTAGWNSEPNCFPDPTPPYLWRIPGCDPIGAPLYVAAMTGTTNPVKEEALIQFLLERGLDFAPGSASVYSNVGYLVLGEIIETVSGLSYQDYVSRFVLEPAGICNMQLGTNRKSTKHEREGEYTGDGYMILSCYGNGATVTYEYGGLNIEAMSAHGGWIATAPDLVRFLLSVDGSDTKPDILNAASLAVMTAPSARDASYAKGWSVNQNHDYWHYGSLPGTASFVARTSGGFTWAIILNKRVANEQATAFWNDLDRLPWNCIANTTEFPDHDLLKAPERSSTGMAVDYSDSGTVHLTWSPGSGDSRIVVGSEYEIIRFPADGETYSADAAFGSGDDLGQGNFVVYSGNGNSVTVTGLEPETEYFFRVFECSSNEETGNFPLYRLCNSDGLRVFTSPAGVADELESGGLRIRIYPNPILDYLVLDFSAPVSDLGLRLYDLTGNAVLDAGRISGSSCKLDISRLSRGVYVMEILTEQNGKLHCRIIRH